jgi:hypothetical protein
MLNWLKLRRLQVDERQRVTTPPNPGRVMAGEYLLLHKYLSNRYADTVVLTFAQIEDLLGFPLPDQARLQRNWWLVEDAKGAGSPHADAWILARRTAMPDLVAKTVMFDRLP